VLPERHRELTIADELAARVLDHVLPVFDAGQDPDIGSYFVIMPRADLSLEQYLRSQGGCAYQKLHLPAIRTSRLGIKTPFALALGGQFKSSN
jgi:hypothetical protein